MASHPTLEVVIDTAQVSRALREAVRDLALFGDATLKVTSKTTGTVVMPVKQVQVVMPPGVMKEIEKGDLLARAPAPLVVMPEARAAETVGEALSGVVDEKEALARQLKALEPEPSRGDEGDEPAGTVWPPEHAHRRFPVPR